MKAIEGSLVRLVTKDGAVAGAGVLVTDNQVLTCAHVVERVLLRPKSEKKARPDPNFVFHLEFPLIAKGERLEARVVRWSSVDDEDVATLQIEECERLPQGVSPSPLVLPQKEIWGKKVRAFGFPAQADDGVWAEGELRGPQSRGWIHIDHIGHAGYAITTGFSGGPIWDPQLKGVIGIVVAADTTPGVKSSYMIPSSILGSRLRFSQGRGTVTWSLYHLRGRTLAALLDDLLELESDGLEDLPCKSVKVLLGRLVHSASIIDDAPFWSGLILEDLEEFEELYRNWNDYDGPERPKNRMTKLKEMRKARRRIAEKTRTAESVLANQLDSHLFDNVYAAIDEMCAEFPEKFRSLQKAAKDYWKKRRTSV